MGLLDRVGTESAEEIKKFFDGMGLPVPDDGEYYCGTGSRYLVFLSDYGVVIRMTPNSSLMEFDNPHFLKSLFTRKAGNHQIDIDPGIECPASDQETNEIYKMLWTKFSIMVGDGRPHNLGFLPDSKLRYPVMIDLDPEWTKRLVRLDEAAVSRLTKAVQTAKRLFLRTEDINMQEDINPQDEFFAPLKEIIDESWPANQNAPVLDGSQRILQACKDFKSAGKLVSPWKTDSYLGTTGTANKYQQRLESMGL